ncbi:hypothetical protein [Edaphobacter aggregans]|uniref:hypothetical protein n=1 Tax=Edaphobacter aggregans TaxID=570835 RepID=UPI000689CE1D|nr:hypothetical protein [Edaphobacter aggregans]
MAAFHEAFADIVALFQHFSIPEALRFTIASTRGNLRIENLLADLAQQFGQASSGSRALRSGLGKEPSPKDYDKSTEPHARGAVLLAAIFEAFLNLYETRSTDLKRLATGGTGVLQPGDIPNDLVTRLSVEAAATASRVLTACIRALDYCPPVDLTFGTTSELSSRRIWTWNLRPASTHGSRSSRRSVGEASIPAAYAASPRRACAGSPQTLPSTPGICARCLRQ